MVELKSRHHGYRRSLARRRLACPVVLVNGNGYIAANARTVPSLVCKPCRKGGGMADLLRWSVDARLKKMGAGC
jgi:hypothetical protein